MWTNLKYRWKWLRIGSHEGDLERQRVGVEVATVAHIDASHLQLWAQGQTGGLLQQILMHLIHACN